MEDGILVSHFFLQGEKIHRRQCRGQLELFRIKRIARRVPPGESRALFAKGFPSLLCTAECWLVSLIWQDFLFFSSDFWINLSSFSWAVRQTDRDRLLVAWAFGTACLLHSSSAQILLTSYLDADILLMVSPLLSTCSWKLLAHLVPFPSEWSSLPGPKRTSTGQKYIWHQAVGAAGCAVSPKLF